MKERNYTIEFYRAMFAINFVVVHCLMVFPIAYFKGFPLYVSALDIIIPFMAFSGYFMMAGFKKKQARGQLEGVSAGAQALDYLKTRLVALMPLTLFANILGFVAKNIWQDIPLKDWPVHLLNAISEFSGLFITGMGFGNASVGMWGEGSRVLQIANTPLWFISGIFVVGYFVYYLIAKNEKLFSYVIAPLGIIAFYASNYQSTAAPMWYDLHSIGSFTYAAGVPLMFAGLSIGALLWYPVEALKNKKFTKGMTAFLTIVQIILTFVVFVRTWVPTTSAFGQWFNISWVNVHLLSTIFSFLVLLNKDHCTRFPLFSSKIWALPGRLALYVYAIHFPLITFIAMAMGLKGQVLSPETAATMVPKLILMTVITEVVAHVLGFAIMKFDQKVLQPWLKSSPWFVKEEQVK